MVRVQSTKKQYSYYLEPPVMVEFKKKLIDDNLKATEFIEKVILAYINLDNEDFINDPSAVKAAIKSITDNA